MITVASYSRTLNFTGISSLHKTRFIVANAPHAWVIRRCMSRSSFNDGVKMVPRYLNLSVYEKNSNSLIIMSAVSVAVAIFPTYTMRPYVLYCSLLSKKKLSTLSKHSVPKVDFATVE